MKLTRYLLLSAAMVLSLASTQGATAGVRVSLLGEGNLANTKTTVGPLSATTTAKLGFGGGALLEFNFGRWGIETGGVYKRRVEEFTLAGGTVKQSSPYVQIPVLFKLWFSRVFALDLGGYFAKGAGKVKQEAGGLTGEGSFADAGRKNTDFGISGGLTLNLPLGSMSAFTLAGLYNLGLSDQLATAVSGATLKWQEIEFFAGVTFGAMKK